MLQPAVVTAHDLGELLDSLMIAGMHDMSESRLRASLFFIAAIGAALTLAAAPASAQLSDQDRARVHFQTGTSYYDQGRYQDAAAQFREAFHLSGRSHVLLNVSRCLELASDFGPAAAALEEYLAAEPNAPDRRTLEVRIAQLRARAPQDPSGSAGSTGGADLTAPAVFLGIGGALALGGVGTGIATLSIQSSLDSSCGADRICAAELRGDVDTGRALAITTDVLLGAGVVALGLGAVWLILALGEGDEEPAALTPSAACALEGCIVGARGRF